MATKKSICRAGAVPSLYYAPILQSWRMKFDTYQIARSFGVEECDVARIVAAEQDRRYREWTDAAPSAATA